jgi:hypothetical protein
MANTRKKQAVRGVGRDVTAKIIQSTQLQHLEKKQAVRGAGCYVTATIKKNAYSCNISDHKYENIGISLAGFPRASIKIDRCAPTACVMTLPLEADVLKAGMSHQKG